MRRTTVFISALLTALWLHMPLSALQYVDEFTDGGSNNIKSYSNLSFFDMDSSFWSALPDRTVFSFSSTASPIGSATYRVQNAEKVTVGFYTLEGSFYSWVDYEGDWVMGLYGADTGIFAGKQLRQAGYSPAHGAIYANIGGVMHSAATNWAFVRMQEPAPTPPDTLIGYGINVYTSASGRSWSRVDLTYSELYYRPGAPFVYEELTGRVPSGTQFVKVELNDVQQLPVEGGGARRKTAESYNCIASVAIEGANLTVGVPEPIVPEPEPQPEWEPAPEAQPEPESESGKAASSKAASTKSSSGRSAASSSTGNSASSPYSGSKFEGVIVSSSGSSTAKRASSTGKAPLDQTASPTGIAPGPTGTPAEAGEGPTYHISAKNGDNKHFTAGVTVYIIVVTGALAFIVLTSATKGK